MVAWSLRQQDLTVCLILHASLYHGTECKCIIKSKRNYLKLFKNMFYDIGFPYNALPGEDIDEHCNLGHFLQYLPVT